VYSRGRYILAVALRVSEAEVTHSLPMPRGPQQVAGPRVTPTAALEALAQPFGGPRSLTAGKRESSMDGAWSYCTPTPLHEQCAFGSRNAGGHE
jgi:hypothetical protein